MKDALSTAAVLVAGFVFLLGCGYAFLVLPARMSFRALAESNKPLEEAKPRPRVEPIDFNEPEEEEPRDPAALRDDPKRLPAWTAMRLSYRMLLQGDFKADEVLAQIETLAFLGQAQALAKDEYGATQSFGAAKQIADVLPAGSDVQRSTNAFIAARLASSARGAEAIEVAKAIDDAPRRRAALIDVVARLINDGQSEAKLAAAALDTPIDRAWGWQKIAQTQAERNLILGARQALKQAQSEAFSVKDKTKLLESRILVGLALAQGALGYKKEALQMIDPVTFLPDRVAVLLAIAEEEQKAEKKDAAATLRNAEFQATQIEEPLHRIDPDLQIAHLYRKLGDSTKAAEVAKRSLASVLEVPKTDADRLRVRATCFNQIGELFHAIGLRAEAEGAWNDALAAAAELPSPEEQTRTLLDIAEARFEKHAPPEVIAQSIAAADARLTGDGAAEEAAWRAEALTRLARLSLKRGDEADANARLDRGLAIAEEIPEASWKAERMRPLFALLVRLRGWEAGESRARSGSILVWSNRLFGAAEGLLERIEFESTPATLQPETVAEDAPAE